MVQASRLDQLDALISPLGLCQLGALHVEKGEQAVPGRDRQPQTIVLVGNAGSTIWEPFNRNRDRDDPDAMNNWTKRHLDPVAESLGCDVVYPFGGPPWYPFITWAMRSSEIFKSRLGMGLHARYGIFHGHRGAFLFQDRLEIECFEAESPCESCSDQPCLTSCPVSAFEGDVYYADRCKSYLAENRSADCWYGCIARKACPVGQDHHYLPEHAWFHMNAFVRPDME